MPDSDIDKSSIRWLFHMGGWGFSLLAIVWGAAILFQGQERVSTPAWSTALKFGGPGFWGAWMLTFGGLMLLAMILRRNGTGLMIIASICVSFALFGRFMASCITIFAVPPASLTSPPAWFAFTCIYMAQGMIHGQAFSVRR